MMEGSKWREGHCSAVVVCLVFIVEHNLGRYLGRYPWTSTRRSLGYETLWPFDTSSSQIEVPTHTW